MRCMTACVLVTVLLPPSVARPPEQPEPPAVRPSQQAERSLKELVGEEVFRAHLVFLPDESRAEPGHADCPMCSDVERRPHLLLIWAFRMAGMPFVDERVLVIADERGDVPSPPSGLPDCKTTPALCGPFLDESEVLLLAREARFEKGLEPWKTSFHFNAEGKRFVWTVSNLLVRGEGDSEEGDMLMFDAVSGAFLGRGRWFAIS